MKGTLKKGDKKCKYCGKIIPKEKIKLKPHLKSVCEVCFCKVRKENNLKNRNPVGKIYYKKILSLRCD